MAGLETTLTDTVQNLTKTTLNSVTNTTDVTKITEKANIATTSAGTTITKPGTIEFNSTENKNDFVNSLKDTTELKDATVKSVKDSSVSNETSKNLFENYKSLSEKVQEARKPRTITDMYFEDDEDEDPFVGVRSQ